MNRRGFTLLELVVTIVVIGILAAISFAALNATRRNTSVENTGFALAAQLQGLRFTALAEQRDHLLVVASPPGNDVTGCSVVSDANCVQVFVLRAPQPTWNVAAFDADAPGVNAEFVDSTPLPPGTLLDLLGVGTPAPAPFASIRTFAPDVTANCADGRFCIAIRFASNGEVRPEYVAAPGVSTSGVAIGITSDLLAEGGAAQRRALMVSFPSGIAKRFPY